MKAYTKILRIASGFLASMVLLVGCDTATDLDKDWESNISDPIVLEATSDMPSGGVIDQGDVVNYEDLTDESKIVNRLWSFPGGSPGESLDASVTVTYNQGGTFTGLLTLQFIDNTVQTQEFDIEVIGAPVVEVPGFGIYTETSNSEGSIDVTTENNQMVAISKINTGAYEGSEAYYFQYVYVAGGYGLHATLNANPSPFDASAYADGYYNVAIKTSCVAKVKIRMRDASGTNYFVVLDNETKTYGLERDGLWHALKIPLSSFTKDGDGNGDAPDLSTLSNIFVLRSDEGSASPAEGEDWDFYVDDIHLSLE